MDNLLAGITDPPCFKQDQPSLSVVQRRCRADEWPLIKPFRHLNIHSDRKRNPIHFPPERLLTSARNCYSHPRNHYSLRSESAPLLARTPGTVELEREQRSRFELYGGLRSPYSFTAK